MDKEQIFGRYQDKREENQETLEKAWSEAAREAAAAARKAGKGTAEAKETPTPKGTLSDDDRRKMARELKAHRELSGKQWAAELAARKEYDTKNMGENVPMEEKYVHQRDFIESHPDVQASREAYMKAGGYHKEGELASTLSEDRAARAKANRIARGDTYDDPFPKDFDVDKVEKELQAHVNKMKDVTSSQAYGIYKRKLQQDYGLTEPQSRRFLKGSLLTDMMFGG